MGSVLLVEDEELVARAIARLCPCVTIVHATTADEAIAFLRSPREFEIVVIDVVLGADSYGGLRVLDVACLERPGLLRVLLSATQDEAVLLRAVERSTPILPKPSSPSILKAIICPDRHVAVDDLIAAELERFGLHGQLAQVFRHAVNGLTRKEMAEEMDISIGTIATYVRRLLSKVGAPTIAALRQRTLRLHRDN